jgi:predicted MFS family arabinose efflux permease
MFAIGLILLIMGLAAFVGLIVWTVPPSQWKSPKKLMMPMIGALLGAVVFPVFNRIWPYAWVLPWILILGASLIVWCALKKKREGIVPEVPPT